ncbi:hypothetical protein D3C72_2139520 [compost metagenome]
MPQLGASNVFESNNRRAVVAGTQDDVLEFRRLGQASLGGHGKRLLHRLPRRRLADPAYGELLVLIGDGFLYIGGGDAQLGHTVRL